jgi:SAM-dependent methyltransferase
VSAVVRAALVGGVFDAVAGGTTRAALRERWPGAPHLDRLLEALSALGLLVLDADGGGSVAPTAIAARHLVRDSPEFVGDAILHDTKPLIWRRFGSLDERLGLPAVHPHSDDGGDEHALFLRAMTSVAAASQARSLLAAVDFTGARRLLDVGGARGDYAIAICAHVPDLHAVVLDLPKSEPLAMDRLRDAPPAVASRISFVGGDYRRELPGGFDTILLSNVLRGEVLAEARALLDRCAAGLLPGGRLVIQDLFPDDPAGRGPLAAALFGLHMPEAANPSVDATVALLRDGGWLDVEVRPIDGYVVADRAVVARKP